MFSAKTSKLSSERLFMDPRSIKEKCACVCVDGSSTISAPSPSPLSYLDLFCLDVCACFCTYVCSSAILCARVRARLFCKSILLHHAWLREEEMYRRVFNHASTQLCLDVQMNLGDGRVCKSVTTAVPPKEPMPFALVAAYSHRRYARNCFKTCST